jgi:hypothetical protein
MGHRPPNEEQDFREYLSSIEFVAATPHNHEIGFSREDLHS